MRVTWLKIWVAFAQLLQRPLGLTDDTSPVISRRGDCYTVMLFFENRQSPVLVRRFNPFVVRHLPSCPDVAKGAVFGLARGRLPARAAGPRSR